MPEIADFILISYLSSLMKALCVASWLSYLLCRISKEKQILKRRPDFFF
jgi:hypothetical protein